MKSKGGHARSGDVIPYLLCRSEGEETAKSAQADRAKHPDEFRRASGELKIGNADLSGLPEITEIRSLDFEYYLSQQVLPPIERLCEPIEGTDRARLAECLGWFR
jgi:DNA polymerase alpha subunit A